MKRISVLILIVFIACENNTKNVGTSSVTKAPEVKEQIVVKKTPTKKQIYLTFDDGPTKGSKQLYKFIVDNKLPVGLFLVGEHYQQMQGIHKELDYLSTLDYVLTANHSFSHAYNDKYQTFYNDFSGVFNDYKKSEAVLPLNSNIARTAGRNFWRLPNIKITDDKGPANGPDSLVKSGYQFLGWDCTWPYNYKNLANTRTVDGMMKRIQLYFDSGFTKIPNNIIILIHDQQLSRADNFREFEAFVHKINSSTIYEFGKINDYPALAKIVPIKNH